MQRTWQRDDSCCPSPCVAEACCCLFCHQCPSDHTHPCTAQHSTAYQQRKWRWVIGCCSAVSAHDETKQAQFGQSTLAQCGLISYGGCQLSNDPDLPAPSATYSAVQYSTVRYSTVQYGTVQYSTKQCNASGDEHSLCRSRSIWFPNSHLPQTYICPSAVSAMECQPPAAISATATSSRSHTCTTHDDTTRLVTGNTALGGMRLWYVYGTTRSHTPGPHWIYLLCIHAPLTLTVCTAEMKQHVRWSPSGYTCCPQKAWPLTSTGVVL